MLFITSKGLDPEQSGNVGFDLVNLIFENNINIIIVLSVQIHKLPLEGRIYAWLNWGISIEYDSET